MKNEFKQRQAQELVTTKKELLIEMLEDILGEPLEIKGETAFDYAEILIRYDERKKVITNIINQLENYAEEE